MLKKLDKFAMGAGALALGGLIIFTPELAMAQESLDDFTARVGKESKNIPQFINIVCYIVGVVTVALGVIKLKQHIEQPTQHPLKDGVARVAFGALLLSLPFLLALGAQTMQGNQSTTGNPDVKQFKFNTGFN